MLKEVFLRKEEDSLIPSTGMPSIYIYILYSVANVVASPFTKIHAVHPRCIIAGAARMQHIPIQRSIQVHINH